MFIIDNDNCYQLKHGSLLLVKQIRTFEKLGMKLLRVRASSPAALIDDRNSETLDVSLR